MATTADHIAARNDTDLIQRLTAMAEMEDIPSAATWVQNYLGQLVSTPVDESGQTLADIHAYAAGIRNQAVAALPKAPGLDPSAIIDNHLKSVVESVKALSIGSENPPA